MGSQCSARASTGSVAPGEVERAESQLDSMKVSKVSVSRSAGPSHCGQLVLRHCGSDLIGECTTPAFEKASATSSGSSTGSWSSGTGTRSEEHTSELQSLMRISYAVFCLKKKKTKPQINTSYI